MKKNIVLSLVVQLLIIFSACARNKSNNSGGMINPGDEIDGMVFTTADEIDWNVSLSFLCDFEKS